MWAKLEVSWGETWSLTRNRYGARVLRIYPTRASGSFWWGWFVTVLNVHEVHTSAGCPKQGLRVLAAMPTVGEISSADLCGSLMEFFFN